MHIVTGSMNQTGLTHSDLQRNTRVHLIYNNYFINTGNMQTIRCLTVSALPTTHRYFNASRMLMPSSVLSTMRRVVIIGPRSFHWHDLVDTRFIYAKKFQAKARDNAGELPAQLYRNGTAFTV